MKRIITTLVITIAVASFATVAVAGGREGKGKHRKGDRIMKALGQLELSPEQQESVKLIHEGTRSEAAPLRKQLRDLRQKVRDEWGTGSPNEKSIIALHKQIHALKGRLEEWKIEARIDTMAVLAPEQREKLAKIKADRRANGKGKRSGRKGRGKGKRSGKKGYGEGMCVDPTLGSSPRFKTRSR
jgi:Spy/CpxP family protein refolding chaperone